MYERFSDRARKVMQLANQEAQRFNHEYIGTEHILIGLMKAGGVAVTFLNANGLDLRNVRLAVEKIVHRGPDIPITGKVPVTPRAKQVVDYAIQYAASLHNEHVGTEHLLYGLLRETEGVAAKVLTDAGVSIGDLRGLLGDTESKKPESFTFPASIGTGGYYTGNLDSLAGLRKPSGRNSQQLIDSTKTMKYRGVPVQELDRESLLAMIGYMALKITNAGAIRQDRADRLTSMREQIDRLVSDGMTIEDALAKVSPEPRREPPRPADERDEMRDFFFKTKE